MSRSYQMDLYVTNFDPTKVKEIMKAAAKEWDFNFQKFNKESLEIFSSGESCLCGGLSEEEFANILMKSIWKANGPYCNIRIEATYLEDLPFNTYRSDPKQYKKGTP